MSFSWKLFKWIYSVLEKSSSYIYIYIYPIKALLYFYKTQFGINVFNNVLYNRCAFYVVYQRGRLRRKIASSWSTGWTRRSFTNQTMVTQSPPSSPRSSPSSPTGSNWSSLWEQAFWWDGNIYLKLLECIMSWTNQCSVQMIKCN